MSPGPGFNDHGEGIDRFDVLWWHRAAPLDGTESADKAGPLEVATSVVESYLAGGGGLLLTLYALAAVDALSIESVPPDHVSTDALAEPTGTLLLSLYADHTALESLDGFATRSGGAEPFPVSATSESSPRTVRYSPRRCGAGRRSPTR